MWLLFSGSYLNLSDQLLSLYWCWSPVSGGYFSLMVPWMLGSSINTLIFPNLILESTILTNCSVDLTSHCIQENLSSESHFISCNSFSSSTAWFSLSSRDTNSPDSLGFTNESNSNDRFKLIFHLMFNLSAKISSIKMHLSPFISLRQAVDLDHSLYLMSHLLHLEESRQHYSLSVRESLIEIYFN